MYKIPIVQRPAAGGPGLSDATCPWELRAAPRGRAAADHRGSPRYVRNNDESRCISRLVIGMLVLAVAPLIVMYLMNWLFPTWMLTPIASL